MQSPSLHRHYPISTVLWDCPTTYHSFEILRFQLQLHTLFREMVGSPQLMCIHNVKHDWFSDSAVPHILAISHYMILSSHQLRRRPTEVNVSKLNHYSTLLSCCLRLSDAVTGIIPRLAIIWLAKPWINQNPTGLTTHPWLGAQLEFIHLIQPQFLQW